MGLTESRQPRRLVSSAFLTRPVTRIHSQAKDSKHFLHAMACMQGWRAHMEDAHIMLDTLPGLDSWGFYSVLDGHAGAMAARVSEDVLGATVLYEVLPVQGNLIGVQAAVKRAFVKHDQALLQNPDVQRDRSGTTCTSVLVTPTHFVFANIGDSRTILSRNGSVAFASRDHKPALPAERMRIMRAGGAVLNGRVDGGLAVSRCFGDFDYKKRRDLPWLQQKVSPEPDVIAVPRVHAEDDFLLLACDGIWDVMTNASVLKFVHTRLRQGTLSTTAICEELLNHCLKLGSRDNMSVVIVLLHDKEAPPAQPEQVPAHEVSDEEREAALVDTLAAAMMQRVVEDALIEAGNLLAGNERAPDAEEYLAESTCESLDLSGADGDDGNADNDDDDEEEEEKENLFESTRASHCYTNPLSDEDVFQDDEHNNNDDDDDDDNDASDRKRVSSDSAEEDADADAIVEKGEDNHEEERGSGEATRGNEADHIDLVAGNDTVASEADALEEEEEHIVDVLGERAEDEIEDGYVNSDDLDEQETSA